jgi:hypothetical protein
VGEPISESEIIELNSRAVERSSIIGRYLGSALLVVGSIGAIGWAWLTVRSQLNYGPIGYGIGNLDVPSPSFTERIDVAANGLSMLLAASVAVGVGMLLRVASDYAQARVGGSITGYRAGDAFPEDAED